jgi:hypothetical protein
LRGRRLVLGLGHAGPRRLLLLLDLRVGHHLGRPVPFCLRSVNKP